MAQETAFLARGAFAIRRSFTVIELDGGPVPPSRLMPGTKKWGSPKAAPYNPVIPVCQLSSDIISAPNAPTTEVCALPDWNCPPTPLGATESMSAMVGP